MIDYADRGLVLDGQPNLKLFKQLYWILFCTYTALLIGLFPITVMLRGDFEDMIRARVCLVKDFNPHSSSGEESRYGYKNRGLAVGLPGIFLMSFLYFEHRTKRCLAKRFPQKRMHSVGKYRRNLLTMKNTLRGGLVWWFNTLINNIFVAFYYKMFSSFSPETWFLIYNSFTAAFYLGYLLVFTLKIYASLEDFSKTKRKHQEPVPFYVTFPGILEPRRTFRGSPIPKTLGLAKKTGAEPTAASHSRRLPCTAARYGKAILGQDRPLGSTSMASIE